MDIQATPFDHPKAAKVFSESLRETGFAVVDDHPLDMSLVQDAYHQWFEFFNLSNDEKSSYLFDNKTHAGFVPLTLSETAKGFEVKDIKEFFHYYPWGVCPENLKVITQRLFEALNSLAEIFLQWIEANTPAEISQQFSMPLSHMIKGSEKTLFRILHYPPLTGAENAGAVRAAAHEDINLITILPAATGQGLEVLNKKGEWIPISAEANSLIINIGDMLAECSGGYYRATSHRVVNPRDQQANQSRLSMPLFLHPRDEVRLSQRHTAKSYCDERYEELGLA